MVYWKKIAAALLAVWFTAAQSMLPAYAEEETRYDAYGGGYAATKQLSGVGYTTAIYDASNGLPTSDAMFLLAASDGKLWIGGYSGVNCYDGSVFEHLDTATGMTSARGFYEDSKGRIWVGTNDNGVVVVDGSNRIFIPVNVLLRDGDNAYVTAVQQGLLYEGQTVRLF